MQLDLTCDVAGLLDGAHAQAGRPARGHEGHVESDDVLRRIQSGRVWLGQDGGGRVVHLSGVNPPAFGAARIGSVRSTPRARPCLFTDQANPTSNAIYQALGYESVVDTAEVLLV